MSRPRGTGTVRYRSDGRWEGRITVYDPLGRPVRKTVYGSSSDEVFAKLDAIREQAGSLTTIGPRVTLEAFLNNFYLPSLQVEPKTLDRYRQIIAALTPFLRGLQLHGLSPAHILAIYSRMDAEGLTGYRKHQMAAILRRGLALAVRFGYLPSNPSAAFPLPRFTRKEVAPLTPEQVQAFLLKTLTDRFYPLYLCALDTGARQGELFALEWSDWFQETREVSITKSVENWKGVLRLKEPKTKRSRRRVIVSEKTWAVLEEYRLRIDAESVNHYQGAKNYRAGLVFPSERGEWLDCSNFHRKWFKPALARAGLSRSVRFHDLRHTCATLLLMAGDTVNSVADRLGHSSPQMVWETYGHVLPRMRKESAALMERFL